MFFLCLKFWPLFSAELKSEYEKSSNQFLNELRSNTKFIKQLREKIKNLQSDKDSFSEDRRLSKRHSQQHWNICIIFKYKHNIHLLYSKGYS